MNLAGLVDIVQQSCRTMTRVRVVLVLAVLWHSRYQDCCLAAVG